MKIERRNGHILAKAYPEKGKSWSRSPKLQSEIEVQEFALARLTRALHRWTRCLRALCILHLHASVQTCTYTPVLHTSDTHESDRIAQWIATRASAKRKPQHACVCCATLVLSIRTQHRAICTRDLQNRFFSSSIICSNFADVQLCAF